MQPAAITLREYESITIPAARLSDSAVAKLQRHYSKQLHVELLLDGERRWRLTAQGWVGTLPVDDQWLIIRPKIPIHNLFKMLVWAWDIPLHILPDLTRSATIRDFYDFLARHLAQQVIKRLRRGLYHSYQSFDAALPYIRGRLRAHALKPLQTTVPVTTDRFTADIPHNQLLLHGLDCLLNSGLCSAETTALLHQAHRQLRGRITFTHSIPEQLDYNRLNDDYRPMHALCRLFLAHSAPVHAPGETPTLPFLIDMVSLFERFVARWLAANLPNHLRLRTQARQTLASGHIQLAIDLVIYDAATGDAIAVLDTKYKAAHRPSNADIYQIAFYANTLNAPDALLVYPAPLARPLDEVVRDVRLRTVAFDLSSADVDVAGVTFLRGFGLTR